MDRLPPEPLLLIFEKLDFLDLKCSVPLVFNYFKNALDMKGGNGVIDRILFRNEVNPEAIINNEVTLHPALEKLRPHRPHRPRFQFSYPVPQFGELSSHMAFISAEIAKLLRFSNTQPHACSTIHDNAFAPALYKAYLVIHGLRNDRNPKVVIGGVHNGTFTSAVIIGDIVSTLTSSLATFGIHEISAFRSDTGKQRWEEIGNNWSEIYFQI